MRKSVCIALSVAVVMLFSNAGRAMAQTPSCNFIDMTPRLGANSGTVVTSVEWANCPAQGNEVEVALFSVDNMRNHKALATKSVNNVGASGAKSWTFTGLTPGTKVQANITVYDVNGKQIADVGYTPTPPLTVK